MAQSATVVNFDIALSDVDRGVYESLALKVAQHPSETDAWLIARVLAFALEYEEGIAFSPGLSTSDEPAVGVRDLTGQLVAWIDVGTPDAARLHKATKAAERVAVYCHKDPEPWLRSLGGQRVFAPGRLALTALPREVVRKLAEGLARRNTWALSRVDGTVYLEVDGVTHLLSPEALPWPGIGASA